MFNSSSDDDTPVDYDEEIKSGKKYFNTNWYKIFIKIN